MKSSTEAPAVLGPVERLVRPHATAIRYATIVADPPWKYGSWGRGSAKSRYAKADFNAAKPMPYQTMTVDEIKALPVAALAADNCDLYLWTTQKYLPDSFEVLKAWGFRYCQTLTWCKAPMGTGQGGLFCPTTEFCLLGRKGKMPAKPRVDTTWWNWPRAWKTHSRKPEKFQDVVEGSSDAPRLELFARRERHGWHTWGNEVPCDVFMGPNAELSGRRPYPDDCPT